MTLNDHNCDDCSRVAGTFITGKELEYTIHYNAARHIPKRRQKSKHMPWSGVYARSASRISWGGVKPIAGAAAFALVRRQEGRVSPSGISHGKRKGRYVDKTIAILLEITAV